MTAAILAGGLGTRLRSLVADRPKVLADVLGRPFLAFLLDYLQSAGVKRVVLCTGYKGEQVHAAFGDSYGSLRLAYSHEPSPLGTGGALRLALPLLESEAVFVMNGDSFCEFEFGPLQLFHASRNAAATIVLTQVADTARFARIRTDATGRIESFEEKAPTHGPGWINGGIYLLNRRLVLTIPSNEAVSLERQVFPLWIHQGLFGYYSQGRFLDIGTPESYAAAEEFFVLPRAI